MFEDYFVESRSVRNNKGELAAFTAILFIILLIVLVLINGVPILFGYNLLLLTGSISVILIWGAIVFVMRRSYIEYEIEIVNDTFEGAKILGKNKREDLCEFSLKDCQAIGPVTSDKFLEMSDKAMYRLNLTSYKKFLMTDDNWFIMTGGTAPYMVIFEMKPEMYKVFRRYNPRFTAVYKMPKTEEAADKE